MTLAEHDALLKSEGRYEIIQEQKRQRDAEHSARVSAIREALRPLTDELLGIGIEGISRLLVGIDTKAAPVPEAVPILLKHLQLPYPPRARAVIASCLGIPEARGSWDVLVQQYVGETDEYAKDSLANALEGAANDDVVDSLIALVREPSNGPSRLLLLPGLVKMRDPRAHGTIREMRHDPDLKKEIEVILKKLDRKNH